MFGQLQAVFPGVQINDELLLVARVYSTNVGHDSDRSSIKRHSNVAPSGDEGLVAWTAFSLILPNKKGSDFVEMHSCVYLHWNLIMTLVSFMGP